MKGDFYRTCKNGKPNTVSINQGTIYLILSSAKGRDKLKLVNFESDDIKVNNTAL